jgi:hypothetical protein
LHYQAGSSVPQSLDFDFNACRFADAVYILGQSLADRRVNQWAMTASRLRFRAQAGVWGAC